MMSEKGKYELLPLTGIRYIAAVMVCIFHFNPFTEAGFGKYIHGFFNELHVGVTFFFVLSGFLIGYNYYNRRNIDYIQFQIKRLIRIYPLYLIILLCFYLYKLVLDRQLLSSSVFYEELFYNLTLLKGFSDNYKFSGILQAWSLTVEETFYLLVPFFFFFIRKSKASLIILPVILLFVGMFLDATVGLAASNRHAWFKGSQLIYSFTFLGRSFEFFVGIALALLLMKPSPAASASLSVKSKYPYTLWGIILCTLLIFAISLFSSEKYIYGIRHPMGVIINNVLLPVAIAVLFWGLIKENTRLSKLLSTPQFNLLGKASYAFYLIHLGIGKYYDNIIFVLGVSTLLSVLMYKYIENPLHRFLNKKMNAQ